MISTLEVVLMILLFVVLCVAIWWFVIAERFKIHLKHYSYTKGANSTNHKDVHFTCGPDKEVCVYRATQICTLPGTNNFEDSSLEPIASGHHNIDGTIALYGDFNPNTTVDLTEEIGKAVNGHQKATYHFSVPEGWEAPGGHTCQGNTQLIATYTCIPKGTKCKSWSPAKNV